MNKSILYLKFSVQCLLKRPSLETFGGLIRHYISWHFYQEKIRNPVADAQPWISFSAIDFLKKVVRADMKVFEYGSGGSTLFWAKQVKSVISVEHDSGWYTQMANELQRRHVSNVEYIAAFPETDPLFTSKSYLNPDDRISSDENYTDHHFDTYVRTIDRFADESFDIIIVDGRARPSCIKHSIPKVKKGGYLIVDNTERTYYLQPFSFDEEKWKKWSYYGPVPYTPNFSETTILQKK